MIQLPRRLQSIDVFRAVVMFFMIFVNDFDDITNVPEWIKHVPDNADGLGFADTIFPAFLFIMGLSIPFAIKNRLAKGDSTFKVAFYIATRGLALLVMGFFHVNLEDYSMDALLPKAAWELFITIAFFLIWLDYPPQIRKTIRYSLQGLGIALLIVLAGLFEGYSETGPKGLSISWWGILGLIGWSYLICAFIFLLSKGKMYIQIAAFVFLFCFSIAGHSGWLASLSFLYKYVWIISSGSLPALTMAGIVVSCLYTAMVGKEKSTSFLAILIVSGIAMIGLGFLLRPIGGISKVHDTPSWVAICAGISILLFTGFIYLIDLKQKQAWFKIIKPAGTSTLTCYLVPYLLYSFLGVFGFKYPAVLNDGIPGFLRCVVVTFVVIFITSFLEKKRVRLKI